MDSKVNYALVGLFVIILSLALVASILWLSVGIEQKNYQTYQVYIQESVSGLNYKASVKYRGVKVGYVRDIALVSDRPHEVRVLLDIEQNVPIKHDTLAFLSIQGLTGLAHIELTAGSRDAPAPIRKKGQQYPEIHTKPSLFARLDTTISSLLKNLNSLSGTANTVLKNLDPDTTNNLLANIGNLSRAVNALLSEKNHQIVTNILHNFEVMSANFQVVSATLAARTDGIDRALVNVLKTTENINNISENIIALLKQIKISVAAIENTSNGLAQKANEAIENTSNAFSKTIGKVDEVVFSINKTTKTIGKTAVDISDAVEQSRMDMDYFTRQALPEVTNSLRELQVLLSSLRHFAQELKREPTILLFGQSIPPGPGE
jgi:phospholipid/cholesterol/gamma-HCH transport system substrate-binding protein